MKNAITTDDGSNLQELQNYLKISKNYKKYRESNRLINTILTEFNTTGEKEKNIGTDDINETSDFIQPI